MITTYTAENAKPAKNGLLRHDDDQRRGRQDRQDEHGYATHANTRNLPAAENATFRQPTSAKPFQILRPNVGDGSCISCLVSDEDLTAERDRLNALAHRVIGAAIRVHRVPRPAARLRVPHRSACERRARRGSQVSRTRCRRPRLRDAFISRPPASKARLGDKFQCEVVERRHNASRIRLSRVAFELTALRPLRSLRLIVVAFRVCRPLRSLRSLRLVVVT